MRDAVQPEGAPLRRTHYLRPEQGALPQWQRPVCNRPVLAKNATHDASRVTCKRCLQWLAYRTEQALRPRPCDRCGGAGKVLGGGSGYPKGGMSRTPCPVCNGTGRAAG